MLYRLSFLRFRYLEPVDFLVARARRRRRGALEVREAIPLLDEEAISFISYMLKQKLNAEVKLESLTKDPGNVIICGAAGDLRVVGAVIVKLRAEGVNRARFKEGDAE
jgi:hypothetical protein